LSAFKTFLVIILSFIGPSKDFLLYDISFTEIAFPISIQSTLLQQKMVSYYFIIDPQSKIFHFTLKLKMS